MITKVLIRKNMMRSGRKGGLGEEGGRETETERDRDIERHTESQRARGLAACAVPGEVARTQGHS